MLEIITYEIKQGILTVGFKDSEKGFVVYTSLPYDDTKTKKELLQMAYIQARDAIKYERTLNEHSLTTDETGELFEPEPPKPSKIVIECDNTVEFNDQVDVVTMPLEAKIFDQYGEIYDGDVVWSTTYGSVSGNLLTIPKVEEDIEITITAQIGEITTDKTIPVYSKPNIGGDFISDELVAMAEAIVDLNARLLALESGGKS